MLSEAKHLLVFYDLGCFGRRYFASLSTTGFKLTHYRLAADIAED